MTSCGGDDTKENEIAVSGVSVSPTTLSLSEGEKARLSANVTPADASDKTVSWTSSNESVAIVGTGGEVTGVKAGNATITVTTKDGAKKSTCKVTVEDIALTGISLSPSAPTMKIGQTVTLTVSYTPSDATNKEVTWNSGKPDVASVDQSGKVTAVAPGSSQIVATSKDGGLKAVCNVTVQNEAFTGTIQVDGIYYKPVSAGSVDVMVTYKEGTQYAGNSYSGTVKVPATFDYKGVAYNVTQVGERAFNVCHSLTSVSLPEGLTDIGELAFDDCENLETLSLPASLKYIYYTQAVFGNCKKLNVTVASGGIFKVTDGMLYGEYSNDNRLVLLQQNKTGEVSIPEGITMINLNAIRETAITKITVPISVAKIKECNFYNCPNLKEVVLNWNETQLASLQYNIFSSSFYFVGMVYSDITVSVPKGTKAAYAAHPLWGMGFKIVER